MAQQELLEFIQQKEFSEGLPQGDTFLELPGTKAEEKTAKNDKGETRTFYELTTKTGSYSVPKGVMKDIKKLVGLGFIKVRITRTGQGLDSRYTVVGQK